MKNRPNFEQRSLDLIFGNICIFNEKLCLIGFFFKENAHFFIMRENGKFASSEKEFLGDKANNFLGEEEKRGCVLATQYV